MRVGVEVGMGRRWEKVLEDEQASWVSWATARTVDFIHSFIGTLQQGGGRRPGLCLRRSVWHLHCEWGTGPGADGRRALDGSRQVHAGGW